MISVDLPCPLCGACVTATVEDFGQVDNVVTDARGCEHAEELLWDVAFVVAARQLAQASGS